MDGVNVSVEAEINPTETEEKVKAAVESIFGSVPMKIEPLDKGRLLVVRTTELEPLSKLQSLLRRERIRSAARAVMFEGMRGNVISFCLNKQVAYAGHLSFSREVAESPLGPIRVRIRCDNPRELINWIAPRKV